mmetsp:Transcript_27113/g.33667  ORF Transcript_27113/g.33667 Transcript_27113/m.33667 type:complete len:101 (+) Transcript_27113:24-326(+)
MHKALVGTTKSAVFFKPKNSAARNFTIRHSKRMSDDEKRFFKPLIVCGPACAGKSTLIDYLRFEHKDRFELAVPWTTRTQFKPSEISDIHYKKIDAKKYE